jgi:hypothetical protein
MDIRYVTIAGLPGTHNVYYSNWTYEINSSKDVSGCEIVDFEAVNAAYRAEHPEEEEAAE